MLLIMNSVCALIILNNQTFDSETGQSRIRHDHDCDWGWDSVNVR
jgi:hypothetical protein